MARTDETRKLAKFIVDQIAKTAYVFNEDEDLSSAGVDGQIKPMELASSIIRHLKSRS